tara:strand:- start:221 stop:1315 length:1095 start_codon:yes stop_codon:yes gene_type:complete
LPVGNSDRGVGLGAGEIMVFADYNQQEFDWWHAVVPGAIIPYTNNEENFDHPGLLKNKTLNLGMTIGLNDYWNVTLSQMFSERCMIWEGPTFDGSEDYYNEDFHETGQSKSVHHRTECSDTDFIGADGEVKAHGGILADAKINFKYLLSNAGKGPGNRVFIGGGFVIPSNYTLTESPWTKTAWDHDGDGAVDPDEKYYSPHRHFYLSDGAYKMFTEVQFFKKRSKIPVFWGGTLSYEFPLGESKYGFTPSEKYEFSLLALSGPIKFLKSNNFQISSIGISLIAVHSTQSEWEGQGKTPNSEATAFIPGLSILFGSKAGTFGINIQKGFEDYAKNPGDLDEESDITSITISYRRVLDRLIDALYW